MEYRHRNLASSSGWWKLRRIFRQAIVVDAAGPELRHRAATVISANEFAVATLPEIEIIRIDAGDTVPGELPPENATEPKLKWTRRLVVWIAGIFSRK